MDLLDHGKVDLVDYMGNDLAIVRAARVLPAAQWREFDDPKLLKFLLKNGHSTPFEKVQFTFYVKAPIFVFRQWHRHRTWSYNEVSGRYKELPEEFYVPAPGMIGTQSKKNHQSRMLEDNPESDKCVDLIRLISKMAFHSYKELLEKGCPRELARSVLPLNTYSEMYASVNLWNLLKFIQLRSDEHAQYEIRVYSDAMRDLVSHVVPHTMKAWNEIQGSA